MLALGEGGGAGVAYMPMVMRGSAASVIRGVILWMNWVLLISGQGSSLGRFVGCSHSLPARWASLARDYRDGQMVHAASQVPPPCKLDGSTR